MLRLTVLLCAVLFVTLLIAGEDKGQMRPALAQAVAAGETIEVIERQYSAIPALPEPAPVAAPAVVEPAVAAAAPVADTVAAVVEPASYETETAAAAPARRVVPEPIFTLSALPTVRMDETAGTDTAAGTETAVAAPAASGEVWYVTASSVNVREGPSTGTSVVDKLSRGEAVTVSFETGSEWAHVTVEGDGLDGYVALRFLSPDAP